MKGLIIVALTRRLSARFVVFEKFTNICYLMIYEHKFDTGTSFSRVFSVPWLTGSAACLCLVAGWVEFLAQELAFIFISPSRIIERSFDSSSLHLKATMLVIFPVFLTRTVVWKFSGISFIHGLRFVFFNTFVKAVFGGLRL